MHGAYGIAVISADEPDMLIGARRGSPLMLGARRMTAGHDCERPRPPAFEQMTCRDMT